MREQLLHFFILFITIFSRFLYWAIFLYILMSWVSSKKTPFIMWLQKLVVPIINPFRFARLGMLDFSPVVALLMIEFGSEWMVRLLSQFLEG
jgi:uncharacterized protein YggT (Ycf19 family)